MATSSNVPRLAWFPLFFSLTKLASQFSSLALSSAAGEWGNNIIGAVGIFELSPAFVRDPTHREEQESHVLPCGVASTD